ncbi:hypothetical protein DKX38_015781 [Salix brachista]|uniref:Uncharacterized protein n=1 Tax=Salix brachista TaxID=2182728 RepID=A0A5N5L6U8_9ROSI|nr:hypothetical protein DKX38_015781 [Salix brachista]
MILLVERVERLPIAESFAFLVSTKWYNPAIHKHTWFLVMEDPVHHEELVDMLTGIEAHRVKMKTSIRSVEYATLRISVDTFELLGTPPGAEHIPCLILSSTFFDSRRWGFAVYRLVEKIALLLNSGAGPGRYFAVTSNSHDCFGFLRNGSSYEAVIIAYGSFMLTGYSGGIDGKEWAGLYSAGGSGNALYSAMVMNAFICGATGLEGPIPSSGVTGP